MTNWKNEINTIIKDFGKTFDENELAYLAITSKIEIPLRDNIAFHLQNNHSNKIVCREWTSPETRKRADIAIMNINGEVECIIEFKAHSDMFDVTQWASEKNMGNDIKKSLLISNNPEVYFVLFINYITQLPTLPHHNNIIKYKGSIQRAIKLGYNRDTIIGEWDEALGNNGFEKKYEKVEIDGGSYYDSDVFVISLIHGPFKNKQDETKPMKNEDSKKNLSVNTKQIAVVESFNSQHWVGRTSEESVEIVEDIFKILELKTEGFSLNYKTKNWIGLKNYKNVSKNFITFEPQEDDFIFMTFQIKKDKEIEKVIQNSGVEIVYTSDNRYKLEITKTYLNLNSRIIKRLAEEAKKQYFFKKTT